VANQAAGQAELFVELIDANTCQIIALRIEEHVVQQGLGAFDGDRFTGTQLAVEFLQTFLTGAATVLEHGLGQAVFLAKGLDDLFIGPEAQRPQENGQVELPGAVNTDPKQVVGIGFVFQPGSAVGDNLGGNQFLVGLVGGFAEISARGADKLADDDAFGTIDDEGAVVRHDREFTDIDVLVFEDVVALVVEADLHTHRSSVVGIALLAFLDGIRGALGVKLLVNKRKLDVTGIVRDRRYVAQDLHQAFIQEPLVAVFLNLDEIRDVDDLVDPRVGHSLGSSQLDGTHHQ